jgi:hypothetical protein
MPIITFGNANTIPKITVNKTANNTLKSNNVIVAIKDQVGNLSDTTGMHIGGVVNSVPQVTVNKNANNTLIGVNDEIDLIPPAPVNQQTGDLDGGTF